MAKTWQPKNLEDICDEFLKRAHSSDTTDEHAAWFEAAEILQEFMDKKEPTP